MDVLEIKKAIGQVVEKRRSRFEEQLLTFRHTERQLLVAVAKYGPIKKTKSKDFLKLVPDLSPTGVFTSVKRLVEQAEIMDTENGFVVSDPLLAMYLRRYY